MTRIPDHELHFSFAHASGKGGQNVNKTATKVTVRWSIGRSRVLSLLQKDRLRQKLAHRVTNTDEFVISAESERSQLQNRAAAASRLRSLVAKALHIAKPRRATRPTRSSKEKHSASKKHHSLIKIARRIVGD